jgi:hypothetical protein
LGRLYSGGAVYVDINEWLKFWYHFTGWRPFAGGRSYRVPSSDENYSEVLRTLVILALFIALAALMATWCFGLGVLLSLVFRENA